VTCIYLFIYNQIVHRVQQSKSKRKEKKEKKKIHSCQVIYNAAKFITWIYPGEGPEREKKGRVRLID